MVKRSKTGIILAIIASIFTFALYLAFSAFLETDIYARVLAELRSEGSSGREMAALLNQAMEALSSMMLYFGIANVALGILGWRFKVANTFLAILGWVYLLFGGFVLFLIQGILCIVASSKNKKYWIELELIKKLEREKELREAVETKAE